MSVAGKSIHNAINEVIEVIDFCIYYVSQVKLIMVELHLPGPTGEANILTNESAWCVFMY